MQVRYSLVFLASMAGKVAGGVLLAICISLGFGPDEWVQFMTDGLPNWITPSFARAMFFGMAVITTILLVESIRLGPKVDNTKGKPVSIMTLTTPVVIFALLIIAWSTMRGGPARAVIRFPDPLTRAQPFIQPDSIAHIEARIRNNGPESAEDVQWHFATKTISSNETEEVELDELGRAVRALVAATTPIEISANDGFRKPLEFYMRADIAERINQEEARFYLLSFATWSDSNGKHEAEKCWQLQKPNQDPRPVWRRCQSHNSSE